eukprot:tig00020610_g12001.t1
MLRRGERLVYDPLKAGSIDGTDTTPHDRAIVRAMNVYYDPARDSKIEGDPYNTLFVARLDRSATTEETLHEAFSKFGPIKRIRLVRHIKTGESRGYAFVEFENERAARAAYREANRMVVDGRQILVDIERERVSDGWVPRRLGGGLGGKKESGQLRFGGRDRPFKTPLRPQAQAGAQGPRPPATPSRGGGREDGYEDRRREGDGRRREGEFRRQEGDGGRRRDEEGYGRRREDGWRHGDDRRRRSRSPGGDRRGGYEDHGGKRARGEGDGSQKRERHDDRDGGGGGGRGPP